jgi:predicted nucleotidyltransferase
MGADLDAAAGEVLAAFGDAGVDALLLKGRGLATLLYGRGDHRSFSDVDLLVAPERFDAAERVLPKLGYAHGDVDIDDVGRVVHAHTWVRTAPPSTADPPIDLHRWLPGSCADPAVAWEALVARRVWVGLGGSCVPVLDRVGQAMHVATHAAQHGQASEKHASELALELWPDVSEAAARLAAEIGATEAFAAGLRLSRRVASVAALLGLPATERLDWVIRHRDGRVPGTFHLEALAEAKSLRNAVRCTAPVAARPASVDPP